MKATDMNLFEKRLDDLLSPFDPATQVQIINRQLERLAARTTPPQPSAPKQQGAGDEGGYIGPDGGTPMNRRERCFYEQGRLAERDPRTPPAQQQGAEPVAEQSITLNLAQARALVEFFGGEDTEVKVARVDLGHSGSGLYVWCAEYPEEGSVLLDADPPSPTVQPEEPANAMPLPIALRLLAQQIKEGDGLRDNRMLHHRMLERAAAALSAEPKAQAQAAERDQFNAAINFAIEQGLEAATFLRAWREGDTSEWPEFVSHATPSPEARETAEPIGFITEEALRLLRDPEWLAQRGTYANLWGTDGPPNRAIVPVFAAPVSQPEALPLKSMNWHPGPIKTEWGDGMLVADVELSPDQTLTMFIHKNALPLLKDKP